MLEVTRLLGAKLSTGWRPRRTMIFFSWGCEEFGLIGSRELAEDFENKLMERAVAYVNADICMCGDVLSVQATPSVQHKVSL